jgi:hypothetical protein
MMEQKHDGSCYCLDRDVASLIDSNTMPHYSAQGANRFISLVEEDEKITDIVFSLMTGDNSSVALEALKARYNQRSLSKIDLNWIEALYNASGNDPSLDMSAFHLWITRPKRINIGQRCLGILVGHHHLDAVFNWWVPWQLTSIAQQMARVRNGYSTHESFPKEAVASVNLARDIRMNTSKYYGQFWTEMFGDEEWVEDTICSIMCAKKKYISKLIYDWASVGGSSLHIHPNCIICFNEGCPDILDIHQIKKSDSSEYSITLGINPSDIPVCDPDHRAKLEATQLQLNAYINIAEHAIIITGGEAVLKYKDNEVNVCRDVLYSHFGLMIGRLRERLISRVIDLKGGEK